MQLTTPLHKPYQVVLVDLGHNLHHRELIQLVCRKLHEFSAEGAWDKISIERIVGTVVEDVVRRVLDLQPDTVFVVISEERLVVREANTAASRRASLSVEVGYRLARELKGISRVFFVAPIHISGLDVLTLLHSGANGVIDERSFGSIHAMKWLLNPAPSMKLIGEAKSSAIVIGTPYDRLSYLKRWAIDNAKIAEPHWTLALVFAQIPRTRLTDNKWLPIAESLGNWRTVTGYTPNTSTRRHIEPTFDIIKAALLTCMEIDEDEDDAPIVQSHVNYFLPGLQLQEDDFQAGYLPTYARLLGLPCVPIPLPNQNMHDQAQALYRSLETMTLSGLNSVDGFRRGRVVLAIE